MWRRETLTIPPDLPAVNCVMLAVSPWTYGAAQVQESGNYLSPENALNWLAGQMDKYPGPSQVFSILVTASDIEQFSASLKALAGVLPLPDVNKTIRRSDSAQTLALSRMQIPGAAMNLPPVAVLSSATTRTSTAAQRVISAGESAAGDTSLDDIDAQLAEFAALSESAKNQASAALDDLASQSAVAWIYDETGDPATIAGNMSKQPPDPAAVLTFGLVFMGDLEHLLRMIKR
ncbi:hypothetical protein D8682_05745 [Buttiauxella sp. 3AFRM03]|uniref:hypothetical protein n=1 Tax=Buttiauxella sp. 3AFRM03 TaxID=2479367 RepID=UPI000EF7DF00|nr:hypothetical protein [Buttiauxella sp. 3AFRM03]AYN26538.1 hypothetical protein D8682_05745 [Buttiauxella sp. 3AFRM03]